jgi:hypothetical protein
MRVLWRWLKRLLQGVVLLVLALLAPVGYVELACRGAAVDSDYAAIVAPEYRRLESRTLLTYPEWHIVHAYDDYAEVTRRGDPDEFDFFRAITGYWSSLCTLSQVSASYGGVDFETRQMVYVVGVSFTAEMALKASYEETIGRVFTWLRGPARSPLDDLAAEQARGYADFLQQVPWYQWDFAGDAAALQAASTGTLRDRERAFALGLEYRVKSAYAGVIADAVADIGFDELTLRLIVTDLERAAPAALPGVTVIRNRPEGWEIEVPRYRVLTGLLAQMATSGAGFVEIAGNDDIMLTALSDAPTHPDAIYSFARQGYGDFRHLLMVRVADLAETLRGLAANGLRLEYVHDY